jgi:hypothetical protein
MDYFSPADRRTPWMALNGTVAHWLLCVKQDGEQVETVNHLAHIGCVLWINGFYILSVNIILTNSVLYIYIYILQLGPCIFQIVVKEGSTKCIFQNNHIFRISSCFYMFRRIRSTILRQPNVILMKLYVCYVMNAEQV